MRALSVTVERKMKRQRRRDTPYEVALRKSIHALGYRFRVDVRPEPTLNRRADIIFKSKRVAVFVDGCFWHGCPVHRSWPKHNGEWWKDKIERTMERDKETTLALRACGWKVVRVWEHDKLDSSVRRILKAFS